MEACEAVPARGGPRVYVKFAEKKAATKAFLDLEGRFFGGRKISAAFFDEGAFDRRDFGE